ncbi:VOC family protein [Mucilaginibacter gynuensis]|uniref:VOC family protein n=1 Tax=Mucilaginibacter gynuensis TaxID=1302236 RepID=A0ABP8G0C7_9SPHI
MKKITPFLWFNNNAEEAIDFYTAVFKNSEKFSVTRAGGNVLTATFKLEDQEFIALNGGPHFTFTEAVSFSIDCKSQEEVDHYWEKLSEGGQKSRCGWLKDPFGLSWQVVPTRLVELLQDKDAAKAQRVMQAMMQMDKIIISDLEDAAKG